MANAGCDIGSFNKGRPDILRVNLIISGVAGLAGEVIN